MNGHSFTMLPAAIVGARQATAAAAGDTRSGLQRSIAAAQSELEYLLDLIVPNMGRARSEAVHAKIGAARRRRTALYARKRALDVEQRYADALLRDRLERRQ